MSVSRGPGGSQEFGLATTSRHGRPTVVRDRHVVDSMVVASKNRPLTMVFQLRHGERVGLPGTPAMPTHVSQSGHGSITVEGRLYFAKYTRPPGLNRATAVEPWKTSAQVSC